MTVKDLIERLNAEDPEALVVLYDTGRYFQVSEVTVLDNNDARIFPRLPRDAKVVEVS
jgi:hypothetical protein